MSPEAQRLQALLFLAGEAVSKAELSKLTDLSLEDVEQYLEEIRTELAEQGLTIVMTDLAVQLTTAPVVSGFLKQYVASEAGDLSAAAAETLALIAYRGPIARTQIDALRGVDSRRMTRQLVARGLVRKVSGNDRVPCYVITEDFLQHLGLEKAEDLPQHELLSNDEKINEHLNHADS